MSLSTSITRSEFKGSDNEWESLKTLASYVVTAGNEEHACGSNIDFEDAVTSSKEPYGDVHYADPGYKADKKKRYPIDTAGHIRAAWNYIHQAKNHTGYSSGEVSKIKSRIVSAWKSKIDKAGPPSA